LPLFSRKKRENAEGDESTASNQAAFLHAVIDVGRCRVAVYDDALR